MGFDMGLSSGPVIREADLDGNCPCLVNYNGADDCEFSHNWSIRKKIWVTSIIAVFSLIATVASSIFGTAQKEIMAEFGSVRNGHPRHNSVLDVPC
ncbi:hypothetical protein V1525DRAFT_138217 [Lipomyces kononenkoae]|uniref:Uncharacterized protein n=1 Tax=Lipomyces kononenkoae TaxID=34357 RepID=A0ACC3SQ89_LIPKO